MQFPPSITASGLPWVPRAGDARMVQAIAQQQGISELLAEILVGRGVGVDVAQHFLNPSLRDYLPDPFHLLDMEKAVTRIIAAITAQQPIAEIGPLAARLMLDRLVGKKVAPRHTRFPTRLIVRGSVSQPKRR